MPPKKIQKYRQVQASVAQGDHLFVVVSCLVVCCQQFFLAVKSPNSVVVVFVLGKLKLFYTGGGVNWKCLNVEGDALKVGGWGSWKDDVGDVAVNCYFCCC